MTALSHSASVSIAQTGSGGAMGLTQRQIDELKGAQVRAKKVRRAMTIAGMDAWTCACFAGLTLVGNVTGFSMPATLLGLAMCVVAIGAFRGRAKLKRLEIEAAKWLGYNQLLLMGSLVAYGAWKLYVSITGPGPLAEAMASAPEARQMLMEYDGMARGIEQAVTIAVLGAGVLATGAAAMYYFSRAKCLRAYLNETPAWIVEMHRAGLGV